MSDHETGEATPTQEEGPTGRRRWGRWMVLFTAAWTALALVLILVPDSDDETTIAAEQAAEIEHADEAMDEHMDEGMDEHMDEHADEHMDEHADEHMDEHMDEGMDEHADESMEMSDEAQLLSVEATEFEFEQPEIEVQAGVPVSLTLLNAGAIEHDWVLHTPRDKEVKKAHAHAQAGEEATAVFTLKPGEYRFWCTIPGHREAGMEGVLIAS